VGEAGEAGRRGRRRGRRAAPRPGEVRTVTVRALRDEYGLRYRDWVEANRARVHAETGGRVGYLHIPDMGPLGYSEFHRAFPGEVDRDGLIVDVRWNGGGHVSQLLLEKLARRRVGYDTSRWGAPEPFPSDAPAGPMVAITNEHAGSDGDIFSHCFKLYRLGPLIGKRTWGGVVGIWPRHALVDGTWTTQPEFAFWFQDVGWGVENYGTEPDIEVEVRPQDHAAGRDPQLERGLVEVGRIMRRSPPRAPDFGARPVRRPGRLPALPGAERGRRPGRGRGARSR
jgi:tricorn protease